MATKPIVPPVTEDASAQTAASAPVAPAAPMTDAEKIAMADAKIESDRIAALKADSAKKIAEWNAAIATADARKKKYEGDSEDAIAVREFMIASKPIIWEQIQTEPDMFRKELADYKLSLLTPEEKDFATKWQKAQDDLAVATAAQASLKTEILAKYPDFFGTATKTKPASTGTGTPKAKSDEVREFTGTLLSLEEATKRVLALVAAGTTSETAIIENIYGTDFTINNSKPRFQIHSIRVANNLVTKKA